MGFTHISGYPSAAGRAQNSESLPAKDRRYTSVPCNQPTMLTFGHSGAQPWAIEHQSAWMSDIKNVLYASIGAEHSKCNHMMTLGFKGLRKTYTEYATPDKF